MIRATSALSRAEAPCGGPSAPTLERPTQAHLAGPSSPISDEDAMGAGDGVISDARPVNQVGSRE